MAVCWVILKVQQIYTVIQAVHSLYNNIFTNMWVVYSLLWDIVCVYVSVCVCIYTHILLYIYRYSALQMCWNSNHKIALLAVESRHLQIWLKDEWDKTTECHILASNLDAKIKVNKISSKNKGHGEIKSLETISDTSNHLIDWENNISWWQTNHKSCENES